MISFTYGSFDSTTIEGLAVNDVRRPLVGANRDKVVWVPGRADPVVFPQPRGERLVTIQCYVIGDDYLDRRAILNEITAGLEAETTVVDLVIGDEPAVTWQARLDDCDDPEEVAYSGTFEIVFLVFGRAEA